MKKLITGGIILLVNFAVILSANAGDAAKGKALYAICASCHGANGEGNKALNAPAIAGQETWYLERQLKNFKEGIRGTHPKDIYGAQMKPMAMTLANDAAVADISAYVAALPKTTASPSIGDPKAGQASYAVCASCHGPNGQGNKALNAPALAGQHDWYIATQLKNFKAGIRGTNPKDTYGAQMRPMAMTVPTDAAINNLSAYISSMK